jgi:hypothetical protein
LPALNREEQLLYHVSMACIRITGASESTSIGLPATPAVPGRFVSREISQNVQKVFLLFRHMPILGVKMRM